VNELVIDILLIYFSNFRCRRDLWVKKEESINVSDKRSSRQLVLTRRGKTWTGLVNEVVVRLLKINEVYQVFQRD